MNFNSDVETGSESDFFANRIRNAVCKSPEDAYLAMNWFTYVQNNAHLMYKVLISDGNLENVAHA